MQQDVFKYDNTCFFLRTTHNRNSKTDNIQEKNRHKMKLTERQKAKKKKEKEKNRQTDGRKNRRASRQNERE